MKTILFVFSLFFASSANAVDKGSLRKVAIHGCFNIAMVYAGTYTAKNPSDSQPIFSEKDDKILFDMIELSSKTKKNDSKEKNNFGIKLKSSLAKFQKGQPEYMKECSDQIYAIYIECQADKPEAERTISFEQCLGERLSVNEPLKGPTKALIDKYAHRQSL